MKIKLIVTICGLLICITACKSKVQTTQEPLTTISAITNETVIESGDELLV